MTHETAIRDLIVTSRTLLESLRESRKDQQLDHEAFAEADRKLRQKLDALAERSADTQERLNALIEIVDRIITRKNGGI